MITIAIDTGGTFTDYASAGSFQNQKVQSVFVKNPTNHEHPEKGILEGLHELAKAWNTDLSSLLKETEQISHGTTLALNGLLEKKGVKTALFTTDGFRDALEIRRSQLKNQWDLRAETPEVLVPRRLRLGIEGRMDYKGDEIIPLNEENVRSACKKCREQGVKAIAVCFLFSFLNPRHEERVREIIAKELPHVFVALSSEVAPRIREYERTSTTVMNAYLTPILADYFHGLKKELFHYGWEKPIHIMTNSGGLSDIDAVAKFGVKTLLSGPAGGAVGNEALGHLLGKPQTVLADMGGTSFDLHLVTQGKTHRVPQGELAGYPLSIPMIDISSIGAGGGSIVHVDGGGRVLVGPDSAGSLPGPACYGKGGKESTVTDALLLLGLVDESNFLGGRLRLDKEKAERAMAENVANPLGVTTSEAAQIVYRIASEMMADALRLVTMEKGNDPRDFALIAAGGAFGLFAANIAEILHMKEVLIPIQAPVFCGWGILGAPRRCDLSHSFFMERQQWNGAALDQMVDRLKTQAAAELHRLGVAEENRHFSLTLEMRYLGQHHEISVPWEKGDFKTAEIAHIDEVFHQAHADIYEYAEPERDWEIVDLHVASFEANRKNFLFPLDGSKNQRRQKTIHGEAFGMKGEISVTLYQEGHLEKPIYGPALIEFDYTTVVVPKGHMATADHEGIVTIEKGGK